MRQKTKRRNMKRMVLMNQWNKLVQFQHLKMMMRIGMRRMTMTTTIMRKNLKTMMMTLMKRMKKLMKGTLALI